MPYEISESDGEFWVQNKLTGRRKNKKPYHSKQQALRYLQALEANMPKNEKHGAIHTATEKDKLQAIHDHSASLGADCGVMGDGEAKAIKSVKFMYDGSMNEESAEAYARQELFDISTACYALQSISNLSSEMDEPDDARKVAAIMRGIVNFISGEIDEMESAATANKSVKPETIPAVVKTVEPEPEPKKEINTSYAKSLGIEIPELAVKFVGRDSIKSYTFLWGDPNKVDVEKEYFTKDTDFWDATQKSNRWLTWDHGQDADFKADTRIGQIVDYGDDEIGRWYEAKLDRSHKYRKVIDQLIEEGVLGTSSDSAPQYVIRQKTGKATWLKQWPWFASALTDVPCEPRMIGSIEVLKSWGITLPDAPDQARIVELLQLRAKRERIRSNIGG
jgi:hypothetical protein